MKAAIKAAFRAFVPPIVTDMIRRRSAAVTFAGDYADWRAARAHASGYDSQEILRRVAAATRKVVSGESAYERDSVTFDHIEYSWPLLASLLQVALERKSLRVIDFGGSLGSTWRQNCRFLERLAIPMTWTVVEQGHFVALGREEFSTNVLRFEHTIADAARHSGADVILFASSLCYVEDPAQFLREAAGTSAQFLIIDRLPVVPGRRDRIAVQRVSEPIYTASYPVRLFGEESLLSDWLRDWRLIERWECDLQPDSQSRSQGFFLERR